MKLERLILAMAEHEGWGALGDPKYPNGTRSYRHHNPGNLRVSPFAYKVIDNYAVFKNDAIGFLAFQWDILQKAKGNTSTGLGPNSTLRDLIFTWAPKSDGNDPEKYLADVVHNSGLPETLTLKELGA